MRGGPGTTEPEGKEASPENPSPDVSLRAKSAAGVLWMAAQIWLVRATGAVTFVVVGRQLDPTSFGLVALATGIIAVLTIVSDSGLATYVIRQSTLDETARSTAFWTSMGLAVVLAGALAACSAPLATLFGEPGLTPVLLWLTIALVLAGANSLPNALMRRDLRFRALATRGTISTVTGSIVAMVLAVAGAGVWALVAQTLVTSTVNTVVLWPPPDGRP